jgi:subtilisin family serine protease
MERLAVDAPRPHVLRARRLPVVILVSAAALFAGGHSAAGAVRAGAREADGVLSRAAGQAVTAGAGAPTTTPDDLVDEPKRVLVRFAGGASGADRARFRGSIKARVLHAYRLVPGLQLLEVPGSSNALKSARALAQRQGSTVSYALPDVAYRVQALPDDPLYGEQWALPGIGAPEAWGRSTGSKSVVVAVLDTGIDVEHPDLQANIWSNPDPGQDGYSGDVHGWNFIENNNDLSDGYGHGTHVAGIIGAVGDNAVGISGVNWSVSLMPLKICSATGFCEAGAEIAALEYAVAHGAKIANASFGAPGGGYPPEEEAIRAAGQAGLLFVAAAGNQSANNDAEPFYPASYPLENIISVAASTPTETLASFSNFGADSVSLAAPGENILSTLPPSGAVLSSPTGYGFLSGTSMAAPQVTGAAALLWSMHPSWTMQQIRARILRTARVTPALFGEVSSCGELDLGAASDPEVPELASLCVTRSGSGAGSVSSTPVGVQCGTSCAEKVTPGAEQTLSATPASGSTFAGWSGACSGTAQCVVAPSLGASVTARFDAPGAPPGWEEQPLAAPSEREPFLPGSRVDGTFYNVALSADGSVRAKTIFDLFESECQYADSDTGGVFIERDTPAGWVPEGRLTAPTLGSSETARWANCSEYGALTELSGDGSTLLVAPRMEQTEGNGRYHCAAFVYRHETSGWKLDGTLFPPGVGVEGSPDQQDCDYFGVAGAISDNGDTVAIREGRSVDLYARTGSGWSSAQQIALPAGCPGSLGPRQLAMSGGGTNILVGDPMCNAELGRQLVGRVYAYSRTADGSWSLTQTVEAPEQQTENEFGSAVAISDDGNTATVGVRANVTGLSTGAGAAWVLERVEGHWQVEQRLTAPVDEEDAVLECPVIIENGLRILCAASNAVGLDREQGVLYVFERPRAGWGIPAGAPMSMFASEGAVGDLLGKAGYSGWASLAAAADGSVIDATISPANLANHLYTDNRIGYEFTAPMSAAPAISGLSGTAGAVASQVRIMGANLRGARQVSFAGAEASEYRIDSASEVTATVPEDAKTGPISITTRAGTATSSEQFTVLASLTTTTSPSVAVGEAIKDTATLLGAVAPTGTIGFQLYAASDSGCSHPLLAQPLSATVTGDGQYTSPALVQSAPGVYQWVASYSGDANNAPLEDACDEPGEQITVKARPSLAQSASPTATAGEAIHDSASLESGSSPTGTIGFQLYAAGDSECRHPLLAEPLSVNVSGDGAYASPGLVEGVPGAYQWVATYSGDDSNEPAESACGEAGARVSVEEPQPPARPSEPHETVPPPTEPLAPEPPGPILTPPVVAPLQITRPPVFSGLSLHAERDARRLVVRLTVNTAGSTVMVEATATSPSVGNHAGRRAARPVVVASTARGDVGVGKILLNLPLKAGARLAREHGGELRLTVELTVKPPTGGPQTAIDVVTARLGTAKPSASHAD